MANNSYKAVTGPVAEAAFSRQNQTYVPDRHVQFGKDQCYLPLFYNQHRQMIHDFEIRDDDVWICTFPRSGTTWASEMIWLLRHDLDYDKAAKRMLLDRVPYVEFNAVFSILHDPNPTFLSSMKLAETMKSPRILKTHLPWNMLPSQLQTSKVFVVKPKIIYIARHPKDVVVSFYHQKVLIEGYLGTMDEFVQEFVADLVMYGPYWTHVQEYYERRRESNILFITYENMKKDLSSVIQQTAAFLGKQSLNQPQLDKLLSHLSFASMKANPSTNHDELTRFAGQIHKVPAKTSFIRKGEIDCWKEELSTSSLVSLDEWIQKYAFSIKRADVREIWEGNNK